MDEVSDGAAEGFGRFGFGKRHWDWDWGRLFVVYMFVWLFGCLVGGFWVDGSGLFCICRVREEVDYIDK